MSRWRHGNPHGGPRRCRRRLVRGGALQYSMFSARCCCRRLLVAFMAEGLEAHTSWELWDDTELRRGDTPGLGRMSDVVCENRDSLGLALFARSAFVRRGDNDPWSLRPISERRCQGDSRSPSVKLLNIFLTSMQELRHLSPCDCTHGQYEKVAPFEVHAARWNSGFGRT